MAEPPADPVILCYDGSQDAKPAIDRAGSLFSGLRALVLTVWQPTAGLGSFAWAGATASMVDFFELDRAAAEDAGAVAHEGIRLAREAGLEAEAATVKAPGPVWEAIVDIADRHHASNHCHGLPRAHRPALDAAGKRLQRRRASCPPANPGHPPPKRRQS